MWLVAVAILGAIIVRLVIGVQTVDDAFITFRYSQHIAAGEGFTYNSPQRVLGTSTPLFTLVAALAAGVACACRPDGVLIAGVVSVAALWALPRRSAIRICVLSAAVMVPWVLFATWYFGSPIPNSILAKASLATNPLTGFRGGEAFFLMWPDVLATVLSVAGAVVIWRTRSLGARAWRAWGFAYVTLFTVSRAFNYYPWYFTPLMPLYFAGIAVIIETGLRRWLERTPAGRHRRVALAGSGLALAAFVVIGAWRLDEAIAEVERSQSVREDLYKAVAVALAQSDGGCALAATEIGVLGYYYPGPIVDLVGLVSPEVLRRNRIVALENSAACWLVTYDDHLLQLDRNALTLPWFQREFTLIDRIVIDPTRAVMVYQRANARPRTPYLPVLSVEGQAGTLYRSIQRMLEDGLLVEIDERPDPDEDDEQRRYYRITAFGRAVARAEAQRLTNLVRLARASGFTPKRA